jgi:glycosyltransferase involved in cell wall biosynthesis
VLYTPGGRERWARGGWRRETLYVAPNALDTDASRHLRESISPRELEEFQRAKGLTGKRVIVFAGRLQSRKRPDLLIRAFARIADRRLEAHLVVIGGGALAHALATLVKELDLSQRVSLTGEVFDERLMALYLMSSSLAAMPAAAGLFVQHAFDYGLPIVVGDDMIQHGPEAELIEHGRTGLICPDGNVEQFAAAMLSLLDNEESRQTMGRNARQLIENTYNLQNMAAGLADALRGAITECDSRNPSMMRLRRSVRDAWTTMSAAWR